MDKEQQEKVIRKFKGIKLPYKARSRKNRIWKKVKKKTKCSGSSKENRK